VLLGIVLQIQKEHAAQDRVVVVGILRRAMTRGCSAVEMAEEIREETTVDTDCLEFSAGQYFPHHHRLAEQVEEQVPQRHRLQEVLLEA
jgi:hypothetical protein